MDGKIVGFYTCGSNLIISNILKSYGSCFLYSQFINMIGLKIFGLCLQATKQFEQFVIRKVDQKYQLVFEGNIYDKSKMRYVILREIFKIRNWKRY